MSKFPKISALWLVSRRLPGTCEVRQRPACTAHLREGKAAAELVYVCSHLPSPEPHWQNQLCPLSKLRIKPLGEFLPAGAGVPGAHSKAPPECRRPPPGTIHHAMRWCPHHVLFCLLSPKPPGGMVPGSLGDECSVRCACVLSEPLCNLFICPKIMQPKTHDFMLPL